MNNFVGTEARMSFSERTLLFPFIDRASRPNRPNYSCFYISRRRTVPLYATKIPPLEW
jgi:hypothetical protein